MSMGGVALKSDQSLRNVKSFKDISRDGLNTNSTINPSEIEQRLCN